MTSQTSAPGVTGQSVVQRVTGQCRLPVLAVATVSAVSGVAWFGLVSAW